MLVTGVTVRRMLQAPDGLRHWQQEAVAAWESAGRRGIVASATGTGKTRLALTCIARFFRPGAHVIVIVPSVALRDQWIDVLTRDLRLRPEEIGTFGGADAEISLAHSIVVGVINTGRHAVGTLSRAWSDGGEPVMLVVDECHWAWIR